MGLSQSQHEVLDPIASELNSFCRTSSNDALKSASIEIENSEIKIDLDEQCCELAVRANKNLNEEYVIEICLEFLCIHRTTGCRAGNEYLDAINVLLDEFFTTSVKRLDPVPIRRVFFKVELDAATIQGFQDVHFTESMLQATKNVELDLTLSELIGTKRLTFSRQPDIVKFFTKVIRVDFPSIYQGSIRVNELAKLIYSWSRKKSDDNIVHSLLCKVWYNEILPNIDDVVTEEEDTEYYAIHFVPINLGLVTLLTRDDAKTWYMNKLHLNLCDNTLGVRASDELDSKVRTYQNTRFVDLFKLEEKIYLEDETRTVREVLLDMMTRLRANKKMTYFDAFLYHLIHTKFTSLDPYFHNVCRDIYKAY